MASFDKMRLTPVTPSWFTAGEEVVLSYSGHFSGDTITALLQLADCKMAELDVRPPVRRKLFNIMVESLQNIYHHAKPQATTPKPSLFVGRGKAHFYVATGNCMARTEATALMRRLDEVNAMSYEDLTRRYRAQLASKPTSPPDPSCGAGVGLLDMARRSGHKIEYNFRPIDDQHGFFSLQVAVSE